MNEVKVSGLVRALGAIRDSPYDDLYCDGAILKLVIYCSQETMPSLNTETKDGSFATVALRSQVFMRDSHEWREWIINV